VKIKNSQKWGKSTGSLIKRVHAVILVVRHLQYRNLSPDDDKIALHFELGFELKRLGPGHVKRIKDKLRTEHHSSRE